jgi:hypothetical protein
MSLHHTPVPDAVPVLSRGKHRNPRKGGCFMEFASYLAGEPWSDHPRCTHPLLAAVARDVNDHVSDEARSRLVPLIPSVIGLTSQERVIDVEIAVRTVCAALPIAAYDRQRVLAVSALRCLRMLEDDPSPGAETLRQQIVQALDEVPGAAAWARRFFSRRWGRTQDFRKHTAPHIVHFSVQSIALACVNDVDERLCSLLEECINSMQQRLAATPVVETPEAVQTA